VENTNHGKSEVAGDMAVGGGGVWGGES
jgi:hypothetical protein